MNITRKILLLILASVVLSGCTIATVRSLKEDEEAKQGFSPEAYVQSIWETEFIPTLTDQAVEISELLAAIDADETAATEQYGNRTSTGPYSFMTRGEARILELNRESRVGLAPMDLTPFDGNADVYLAIGPVLRGNALRDAVGFISFTDFTNQVEFAGISTALKDRVMVEIIESTDLDALVGQTVRFLGAFTLDDRDEIVIMPVQLEAVE